MPRHINRIVVHCSATREGGYFTAADIRRWHKERGWSDIGYHYVVRLDGWVEVGRPVEKPGAHAKGYNEDSIGVCYVGGLDAAGKAADTRTDEQKASLKIICEYLCRWHNVSEIVGHRELPGVKKDCPCFEVQELRDAIES